METASISENESSEGALKPIPRERAFLETYFYTVAQFQFDRAHELAEKEKDVFKPDVGSNWMSIIMVLINLAYAEKNYFSMTYIEKRLFKQTSRPFYSSLLTDLSKQTEVSGQFHDLHGVEALTVELSKQLRKFIHARQKMIDFYELMCRYGSSHSSKIEDMIKLITEISREFSKEFHHPILDPVKTSFTYEVDIILTLFQCELNLAEWNFLDSLLFLRESQSKLKAWCSLAPSTSVKEQLLTSFSYKSFFGRTRKQTDDIPFLFQWLQHLYSNLFSKFSFYFYSTLSIQAPPTEIKACYSKLSVDYISKLINFQKKTDAVSISLVLDTTTKKDIYCGHGYHLDTTIREKPTGMNSYPSVVNIPDLRPKEHWPNIISIINDQRAALRTTDKIVYFYDSKLESSYFLIKVDVRMTLVLIYNIKKKERDNYIQTFLTELKGLLNHEKLYGMLKPGQAKAF